jgi:hypothetical protein
MHTERVKGEPRRFGRDAACNVSISRRRFYNPDIRKNRRGFLLYSHPQKVMHTERVKGEPRRFGRDAACNVSISRRRFYNPDIRKNRRGFFLFIIFSLTLLVVVTCLVFADLIAVCSIDKYFIRHMHLLPYSLCNWRV